MTSRTSLLAKCLPKDVSSPWAEFGSKAAIGAAAAKGWCRLVQEIFGEVSSYSHTADSGSIITKRFCPNCGSLLFGNNSAKSNVVSIRAGTVDQLDLIKSVVKYSWTARFHQQVYTKTLSKHLGCWHEKIWRYTPCNNSTDVDDWFAGGS